RLDLPSRGGDIAEYKGKYYSHFPPLFTIICYVAFGLHRLILGNPPVFWGWIYVLLVAAPVPGLAYLALRRAMWHGHSAHGSPALVRESFLAPTSSGTSSRAVAPSVRLSLS